MRTILAASVAAVTLMFTGAALASEPEMAPAVTHHTVQAAGKALAYTAEVGRVAIRDVATGEIHGWMGYIAYRVSAKGPPRPLTFVWNGGPGSDSSTLHFGVVGPKRNEDRALVDNHETWLSFTDLVFVDPIGTGFSRPTKAEYEKEFYGTVGDVASVTEFVRSWRLLHGADATPTYLAGESWGAGRAGSVGYALVKRGVPVKGLVLISGGAGLRSEGGGNRQLSAALRIVDLAQSALFHNKLGAGLPRDPEALRKSADDWARNTYAPALAKADSLSDDERTKVIGDLSRYSGLPVAMIDRKTLSFTPRAYREGLLKDQGKVLDTFDMRQATAPRGRGEGGEGGDGRRASPIMAYVRGDLGYHTDLPYIGVERAEDGFAPTGKYPRGPGASWNYATAEVSPEQMAALTKAAAERGGGPPSFGPPLPSTAEAIAIDPQIKVLVAAGRYDSLNSCTANSETERNLTGQVKAALRFKCYVGGHMFYHDQPSRLTFSQDIKAMIEEK
jgi:carboxypeptidase C (cathepsin A)